MTDKQIEQMLKDIVKHVDYDVYKGIYINPEEPETAKEHRKFLIQTVKNHIKQK